MKDKIPTAKYLPQLGPNRPISFEPLVGIHTIIFCRVEYTQQYRLGHVGYGLVPKPQVFIPKLQTSVSQLIATDHG